jgi:regulator-associated protein of mTOR
MSSALWINESSTSLLLTGTNDGTVRIHDGLFDPNDDISREKPSVISSFVAAPDIVSDKRYLSGLVLEFQQCGGQLIAGGNTKIIRCWDVSTGKCRNSFDSKSDASLTALTTAWDYDYTSGYSGIGPDIIVAGYGNGSLRVFDTRSDKGDPVQLLNDELHHNNLASRRRKCTEFDEHTSWIVDVSFATYSGRHEVSSEDSTLD